RGFVRLSSAVDQPVDHRQGRAPRACTKRTHQRCQTRTDTPEEHGADVYPVAVPVEEALFIGVVVGLSPGMDRDTSSPGRVVRLDVLRTWGLRRKLLPDGGKALCNIGDH